MESEKLLKISTGINGLDKIIGGYPKGRSILITGGAGCGKTIMALQFAIRNANDGLKTVYLATEEDEVDLKLQCKSFGWEVSSLMEDGLLNIISLAGTRAKVTEAEIKIGIETMKGDFEKIIDEIPEDANALVIDNIGSHTAKLTPYEFRDRFDLLVYDLKRRDMTTLIVLDSATSKEFNEIALFSVYGAIKLLKRENPYTGRRERLMDIIKMRSTRTPVEFVPYRISDNGIEITEEAEEL